MSGSTIAKLGQLAAERWGMFTTAQAALVGVSRKTLSGLNSSGAILRVAQGVYRITGAPESQLEFIYARWLALGGATLPPNTDGTPALVIAGESAAIVQGIGDWFPGTVDVFTSTRRVSRLPDVRLRTRYLDPDDVVFVNALPTTTVERTIADLLAQGADRSLVVDALAHASQQGRLLHPRVFPDLLAPIAARHGFASGEEFADDLLREAGVATA